MNADKDYLWLPMREFLADLAARTATPGGGTVAALVGAIAAAQARMVIEYSRGKGASAQQEARLAELLEEFKRATDMFTQLMREDMAAYERFAASRKSGQPGEKERALAMAVTVPMEIVVLGGAVLARLDELKTLVNPSLLGDLRVAALLSHGSARAASVTIGVNLEGLPDRNEAERLANRLDILLGRAGRHRSAVVHYHPL